MAKEVERVECRAPREVVVVTDHRLLITSIKEGAMDFGKLVRQIGIEDLVIIGVIIFGLLVGIVLLLIKAAPIAVALFFSLGVTALIYRFLGGIDKDTTFMMGGFKVGGTLGALLGVMWLVNVSLVNVEPNADLWIPVHLIEGGTTAISSCGQTIKNEADPESLKEFDLLVKKEGSSFYAVSQKDPNFYLGQIDSNNLNAFCPSTTAIDENANLQVRVKKFKYPDISTKEVRSLGVTYPFSISTGYNDFKIISSKGDILVGDANNHTGKVYKINDEYYFIGVVGAELRGDSTSLHYITFAVAKILTL